MIDRLEEEALDSRGKIGVGLAVAFPASKRYPEDHDDWNFVTLPE